MTKPTRLPAYVWYAVALISLVNVVNYMDRMALAVLAPLIKRDLQLSDGELGLLVGLAFSIFYAICGIPIARWADRGNRRNIVALAAFTWSVMTALCGAAQNFFQLLLARIGLAMGEAGSIAPGCSILCDYVPLRRRPLAFGFLAFAAAMGILLGMALAGWLGDTVGWRLAFVVLAVPGIVLAVLVITTLKEPVRGRLDGVAAGASSAAASLRATLMFMFRCRTYRWVLLYLVANGFVQYGFYQWWPSYYVRVFDFAGATVGLNLGIATGICSGCGVLAGSFLSGPLARRDQRWPLLLGALSVLVSIATALASLFVGSFQLSILLVAVTAFGWGVPNASILTAQYSVVTSDMRATAGSSAIFLTSVLGFGLGPFLVGLLSDALTPAFGDASLRYALLLPASVGLIIVVALIGAARSVSDDLAAVSAQPAHSIPQAA